MAITINNVRFSYCNLLQAVTKPGQTEAKFSVTVLVPKTNTAAKAAIDAAVQQAIEQGGSSSVRTVQRKLSCAAASGSTARRRAGRGGL